RGERVGADSAASGAGPGGIWADREQGAFLGSEAPAAVGGPLAMSRHRAGCGYAAIRLRPARGDLSPGGSPGDGDPPGAVQPGMGLAVVAVEPHELFVKHGVQVGGPRVRPVARADGDPAGDLIEGELAEGHRREHARAPGVRVHRVGDLLDGPAEHVGEDLAPRAGPGAPGRPRPPRQSTGLGASRCRVNLSTAASSHRVFSAPPSNTARTRSSRVVDRDRLWNPPRTQWSSTGVRSPYSHGVKITPWLPGGAFPAIRSNSR